jgi:hypothetical protein
MTASTLETWRSEFVVNSTTSGNQTGPAVTALSSGGFIVLWTDASASGADTFGLSIRARILDTNGNPVGNDFVVNTTTSGNQATPKAVELADGKIAVVWADGSQSGWDASGSAIRAQILSSTGAAVGSEILVNAYTFGNQYDPDIVARPDGGFIVSWTDDRASVQNGVPGFETFVRSFNGSGVGLSEGFTTVGFEAGATLASETDPVLTRLANGNYAVAWTETNAAFGDGNSSSVKVQLWSSSGSSLVSLGATVVANATTAGAQISPALTGLAGGGFVVTWIDGSVTGGDTSSWAIRAQVFNAGGNKLGGEFLVNTTTNDAQYAPQVTSLADGGFVIFYEDLSTAASTSYDLLGQRFSANGQKVGSEFLLNSSLAGAQWHVDAATLADGRVVVTWEDGGGVGDVSGYGIHAKILDPFGGVQTGVARILVANT